MDLNKIEGWQTQGPPKTIKQCKAKLRTLKEAYKKAKDNDVKTGTAPMACPFYNDIFSRFSGLKVA